jgi:hypothetical protein
MSVQVRMEVVHKHRVLRKFAGDMCHCPSKLINEKMHCHGLLKPSVK